MKTISIVDWFDPHNMEHLQAWKDLQKTGTWPQSFWQKMLFDDRIIITTNWQYSIYAKIADAFVKEKLP
jgi:hypothetical protein